MPGGVAEDKTGQEFVSHVKTQWLTEQVVFRMLNDLESQLCATLGEESDEQHRNAVRAEFAAMFAEIMEEFETTFSKDES
jgi:hypothetical protein